MVYIGTNNYGVMVSNDGGKSFVPTNGGFSGRFANAILADRETPNRIYASTINTATGGGFFFVSNDNGESCGAKVPQISRDAPLPTPYSSMASFATIFSEGSVARPR